MTGWIKTVLYDAWCLCACLGLISISTRCQRDLNMHHMYILGRNSYDSGTAGLIYSLLPIIINLVTEWEKRIIWGSECTIVYWLLRDRSREVTQICSHRNERVLFTDMGVYIFFALWPSWKDVDGGRLDITSGFIPKYP